MSELLVVDTASVPWVNGMEAISTMAPEWRANLGPADRLEDCYRKFNTKVLLSDPETMRRVEILQADADYADLTDAYHETVEESYCLSGTAVLSGEGDTYAGTYFWRPPGYIHGCTSKEGFTALLFCEGISPGDESGPVTRRIRPTEEAGTNALESDPEKAVGPRGFVRHIDSALLPWQPGTAFARGQGTFEGVDLEGMEFKVLSRNQSTGAQTLLMRLAPGFAEPGPRRHGATLRYIVLEGDLALGERQLGNHDFVQQPAGMSAPPLSSRAGALLFVKSDGWMDSLAS